MAFKFGKYEIYVKCENCGKGCSVRIKRGTSVAEAIQDKGLSCDNCGCEIEPKEYKTKWLE